MSHAQIRPSPISRAMWVGYLCAGLVVLLWAGFSLSGRYAALAPGVRLTPWDLAALRYMVALPIAVGMYVAGPGRGVTWRRSIVVAVVAGLCFPLTSYVGFTYAPAAHAAVILSGTMPFFVVLGLSLIGAERWTRVRLQSLGVLLLGVGLLGYAAYVQGARPGAWRGDLLFLIGVMAWSWFTIIARRWALVPGVAGALSVPLLGEEIGVLDVGGLVLVSVAVVLGVRRQSA